MAHSLFLLNDSVLNDGHLGICSSSDITKCTTGDFILHSSPQGAILPLGNIWRNMEMFLPQLGGVIGIY